MSLSRSIALLILSLAAASAQEPVEAPAVPIIPPGVSIPGAPPAPAAGAPATPPTGAPAIPPTQNLGETLITEPIEEPKLSGDALAALYGKYTGRRVIVSSAASTAEFRFIQDASPKNPLTYATAAELLKIAATIENFVFVPDEQYPNLDILTLSTSGIRPTGRGVDVYNEDSVLPEGDAVISYVMSLNYIKPAEAVNTFTQIIGQFGAFGSIAPVPNAAAVVITENTSLIRKLIDLKKEIDKPSSQIGTRFIKVQYADVTEIAATLTELLTAQQTAQTTAGIQRADNAPAPAAAALPQGAPGAAPGGQSSGSGEATPVQIIPDPRTNRIFAMGRPVDLLFVEGLVREFDVETSEKNFLRRKLRFLTVSEFLPIAGDALTRAFSGTGDGGASSQASGGAGARPNQASNTGNTRQAGGNNSRSGNTGSTNFGGNLSGGGSGGGGGGAGLSDPSVSSAPESVLIGRTLLVADNITNSIVVQGPPSGLEIIERLLDQIDVKPDQVMISTVIGQLSLENTHDTGVGYLFRGNEFVTGGGGGSPIIPPIINNVASDLTLANLGDLGIADYGFRAYGTVGDLNVFIKALQKKSDFTVLSRPSIFTSNNQKGMISSGERIAIPTGSNSFGGGVNSNVSTQIEYQDVVLKLEVIPLVNSDNEITMQIALLNDEQSSVPQVIKGGAGGGGDLSVPNITTREIVTTATVPNGETIVLGGLIVGRDGQNKSGIPILSDIPYLGKLFSTTRIENNRSELMVFIQPSIVKNDRSLQNVQADMDSRHDVSGPARTFADGPGVLPPVDAIPVPKGTSETSAAPAPSASGSGNAPAKKKSAFRPAHRR